jgi:tRNA modification GTPase
MDTIVAPITPLVTSAVIVLRISGPDALKALNFIKGPKKLEPRSIYFGIFNDRTNGLSDNILYYYFKAPHSYTGEDVLEISFHGNPFIVERAISTLIKIGMRLAEPGEFTKRAFLNNKYDLTQAEAIVNIINAKNNFSLATAFNQLKGSLKEKMNEIKNLLIDLLSNIEALIDFSEEEDVVFDAIKINKDLIYVKKIVEDFLSNYKKYYGLIKNNFTILIVGKPNVGKSTLFNTLVGINRSLVSEIPGTTRDYIEKNIFIKNISLNLIDTAGVRGDADSIEQAGIEKTLDLINDADLILYLKDLSANLDSNDDLIYNLLRGKNYIVVGNKLDLPVIEGHKYDIAISLKDGKNLKELMDLIVSKIYNSSEISLNSEIVILQERHAQLLNQVYDIINNLSLLKIDQSIDIFSFEIQRAIKYISEITGEVYTEEVLNNIFNRFCVGK